MLVIRRTESGSLRFSDGRRTDTAATEEQARRAVTAWGYGNFSFNKALVQMKEAEGSAAPAANPWVVRRAGGNGAQPAAAPVAPPAEAKTETAAPAAIRKPPTMNGPAHSR
ncbi:MAG TPA: hypothetical protein VGR37_13790, partial [Longimicrobiaceae bacterium]|nr:hypothetical protein [Longimicrobiaceae bacterium]